MLEALITCSPNAAYIMEHMQEASAASGCMLVEFGHRVDTLVYSMSMSTLCLQITNIRVVKEAMSEAAYLYAELVHMGAAMQFCDVGGGLGIDYDGTNTDAPASLSYTMQARLQERLQSLVQWVCAICWTSVFQSQPRDPA